MHRINKTLFLLVLVVGATAWAGDFMDTRITWTFGDDDWFYRAGETVPDSPLAGIGDRPGYALFMDNLNLKTKGRENLTHIALYKKMPGFIKGLTTEAGMVIKLDLGRLMSYGSHSVSDILSDDGSYLRAEYSWDESDRKHHNFSATFFPFDTERFRLGYLWDISWGGGNIFSTKRTGPAPGAKLEAAIGPVDFYVGLKTAKVSQVVQLGTGETEQITVQETNYGVLGGLGWDIIKMLRLDLGAGYFQQGTYNFSGLLGTKVFTYGFSGRLSVHKGYPIQTSIDYMLYRNDPNINVVDWWKEKYTPGKLSWSVSGEGTVLIQRLADPIKFGTTKMGTGFATAAMVKIKYGYFRGQVIGLVRNLQYILQNVPSLTPFVAMPTDAHITPEYFVAGMFDYYFNHSHLMPTLTVGIQSPATYRAKGDKVTYVIRDADTRDRLPAGFGAKTIYELRLGLQWDLSEFMSLIGNVQLVHDENLTRLKITSNGQRREFQRANQFGGYLTVRARF